MSARVLAFAALLALGTAAPGSASPRGVTPHVTEFGGTFGSDLGGIALGRDGSVWVNERDRVAHVERDGRVREYRLPVDVYQGGPSPAGPIGLGPGGDMWFSCETCVGRISRDGRIRLYGVTPRNSPHDLSAFAASPNGVWFARQARPSAHIVELNARGEQTTLDGDFDYVAALAAAPDGALWFAASPRT
ncbi:MAG: esterase-like activity of phytase family protein, partial [Candidatus Eremiobacteraeota bacterium]|nr:esterase-like activity of phytase family protein [Candidatus Eremiobacteraeota bacterium]